MKESAKSFEDLIAWQKVHRLVLSVYEFSENFPRKEMFELTSQLRRSIVSIPANIAEGLLKEIEEVSKKLQEHT